MVIDEMVILFRQIIEDTNQVFHDLQRPETYYVVNYLQKAYFRYIVKKYLPFPTFAQNVQFLSKNTADLKGLVKEALPVSILSTGHSDGPWSNRSKTYDMPSDLMFFISAYAKTTRGVSTDGVLNIPSSSWVPLSFIDFVDVNQFISNALNRPIMREPVLFVEDDRMFSVIWDDDQGTISNNQLKIYYLRKPYTLSLDFTEYTDDVTAISTGVSMRVMPGSILRYPTSDIANVRYPGEVFLKQGGYNDLFQHDANFPRIVGSPGDEVSEPAIAVYTHEDIVRLAVQMFLEEAKLKLISKQQAKAS